MRDTSYNFLSCEIEPIASEKLSKSGPQGYLWQLEHRTCHCFQYASLFLLVMWWECSFRSPSDILNQSWVAWSPQSAFWTDFNDASLVWKGLVWNTLVSLELMLCAGEEGKPSVDTQVMPSAISTALGPCNRVNVFLNTCIPLPTAHLRGWWQWGSRVICVINLLSMVLKETLIVQVP